MSKSNSYYALGLLLGLIWGDAGHWLITPHPEASTTRVVLVFLQLLLGFGFFIWALWKGRQLAASKGADGHASA